MPLGMEQRRPVGGRNWTLGVIVAVALGFVMAMLDATVVNVALEDIRRDFGAPLPDLVWIVDAYTLSFAALLLLGGSLADWAGAKRAYIGGLVVFVSASTLCGLAGSTGMLIAARFLQGCGAALFMPSSLSLLTQSFPDRKTRTRLLGVWGALVGAAAGSGPFIGGVLISQLGWRSIFYLNLPIGALGVLLTAVLVRPSARALRPFDFISHVLIVVALAGLSFTLIQGPVLSWFSSRPITVSTIAAAAALLLFILRQQRGAHPVIPHALLRNAPFLALNGMGFLVNFVIFGEIFVVSLFLQQARGASALRTGIEMLPIMGVISFMNFCSGHFAASWGGRRVMMVGNATATIGAAIVVFLGGGSPYWVLAVAIAICNAGFGLAIPAMIAGVMAEAGQAYANVGAAMLNANRQIGALCGVAAMGITLHLIPSWDLSIRAAFAAFSVCLVSAFIFVLWRVPSDN